MSTTTQQYYSPAEYHIDKTDRLMVLRPPKDPKQLGKCMFVSMDTKTHIKTVTYCGTYLFVPEEEKGEGLGLVVIVEPNCFRFPYIVEEGVFMVGTHRYDKRLKFKMEEEMFYTYNPAIRSFSPIDVIGSPHIPFYNEADRVMGKEDTPMLQEKELALSQSMKQLDVTNSTAVTELVQLIGNAQKAVETTLLHTDMTLIGLTARAERLRTGIFGVSHLPRKRRKK